MACKLYNLLLAVRLAFDPRLRPQLASSDGFSPSFETWSVGPPQRHKSETRASLGGSLTSPIPVLLLQYQNINFN